MNKDNVEFRPSFLPRQAVMNKDISCIFYETIRIFLVSVLIQTVVLVPNIV